MGSLLILLVIVVVAAFFAVGLCFGNPCRVHAISKMQGSMRLQLRP